MDENPQPLGIPSPAPPIGAAGGGAPDTATRTDPSAPAQAPPPPRRFCGVCGSALPEGAASCIACAPPAPGAAIDPGRGAAPAASPTAASNLRRLKSAVVLYFSLLAVSLCGIVAGAAGATAIGIEFAGTAAMSAIIFAWAVFSARPSLRAMFRPARAGWFLGAAGAAMLTFGLAHAVVGSVNRWLDLPTDNYQQLFRAGGYGIATVVLMVCVQPAVFEELAFRGIVFAALQPALSATEAVFVSAGMFMILHLSPVAFPHTFAMGVAAGFLRARTESLLPGVLMHFVHNLMCVLTDRSPTG